MLSILSDAALLSRTKCACPTIASTSTICILSVYLTTRMNPSTQSAPPWRSLNFVGIATAYSWGWGCNTHCWVFWQFLEKVDIVFPVGRGSWNWRMWLGGAQLKYNTANQETWPWKVLSTSAKCKMVWQLKLNDWAILNSHINHSRSSQKLPNSLNAKRCASLVLWEVLWGALQHFCSRRTEYKNIQKSMQWSSECYKTMPSSW